MIKYSRSTKRYVPDAVRRLPSSFSLRPKLGDAALAGFERDGLVKRRAYAVMPPHIEYELTPLGLSLTEPVSALGNWASHHIPHIDAAREAFDTRESTGDSVPKAAKQS